MDTDIIDKAVVVTGEELIVFAASRNLPPPPGILPLMNALADSSEQGAIYALAARTLISRGDTPPVSNEYSPGSTIDALLTLVCTPAARVAVTSGSKDRAETRVFGLQGDLGVIQAWNALDLHAVRGCREVEILSAIKAFCNLEDIGPRDSELCFSVGASVSSAAVEQGESAVKDLLRSATSDQMNAESVASLAAALVSGYRGTLLMFNRVSGESPYASAYEWIDPGPSGAWLIEGFSSAEVNAKDDSLRFTRVGCSELTALVHEQYEVMMVGSS